MTDQNDGGSIDYIKVNIDKRGKKCLEIDASNYSVIIECSKLTYKECKSRHDLVGRGIHWERCKEIEFEQYK